MYRCNGKSEIKLLKKYLQILIIHEEEKNKEKSTISIYEVQRHDT